MTEPQKTRQVEFCKVLPQEIPFLILLDTIVYLWAATQERMPCVGACGASFLPGVFFFMSDFYIEHGDIMLKVLTLTGTLHKLSCSNNHM